MDNKIISFRKQYSFFAEVRNQTMLIVLDLNGVLVDVRRYEDPPISDRRPDIVLPNRQKAYFNPFAKEFIDWLTGTNVQIVLYTSRTKSNAAPIERAIFEMCPLFKPILLLHQEDCDGMDGWRPTKSTAVILSRLKEDEKMSASDVVFVDDHPERIKLSGASWVKVSRYDALRTDSNDSHCDLRDAMWKLYDTFRKKSAF